MSNTKVAAGACPFSAQRRASAMAGFPCLQIDESRQQIQFSKPDFNGIGRPDVFRVSS
ncbi:exported hypothetical protein [Cupriavidus taiwanensis]|nr:exported hypothetical protein [Cupriavidus taiwanensis]SPA15060.1 exported hypothetical protein [Cupriavidus taiwanensis]SPA45598.1 exported hypothetical protein [Cupriavidus taiwanensis]